MNVLPILVLCLSCLSIEAVAQTISIKSNQISGKILFLADASQLDTEPLLSDSVFANLDQLGKKLGYEVIQSEGMHLFDNLEDLRAFDLLVSSDGAIQHILDDKQRELFEAYLLGDASHDGGNFLRLGYRANPIKNEMDQSANWDWYQSLIKLEPMQSWASLDEWGEANLPSLRVEGIGVQTLGLIQAASSSKSLPHPYPGENLQGGKVYSTILGKQINDYSRDSNGKVQHPILMEQLEAAMAWMLGIKAHQPPQIQYLDFSAMSDLDKIVLSWETVWEEENDFFDVYRAIGTTSWQVLDQVKAIGNSPQPCRYEYWDLDVQPGGYYYRIKQVDEQKNIYFSDIVFVQLGQEKPIVSLYPNPVRETLHVSVALKEASDFSIQIEDRDGRMVTEQEVEAMMADQDSSIDLSHLSSGVYQVRLIAPEGEVLQTFIKY